MAVGSIEDGLLPLNQPAIYLGNRVSVGTLDNGRVVTKSQLNVQDLGRLVTKRRMQEEQVLVGFGEDVGRRSADAKDPSDYRSAPSGLAL